MKLKTLLLVVVSASLAACGSSGSPSTEDPSGADAGSSSGPDGGRRDAGIRPDAGQASGPDAGQAGLDAGLDPTTLRSSEKAPGLEDTAIAALDHLGPKLIDNGGILQGVNFGVWSQRATRVELVLFDRPDTSQPIARFPMTRFGDVWNVYVENARAGLTYGYIAWGPNWTYDAAWTPGSTTGFVADVDGQGNRFNPNKLLLDPYCRQVHRDIDKALGSPASGATRHESSWAAAGKCMVSRSEHVWSAGEQSWRTSRRSPSFAGHNPEDLTIYSVNVKNLSASPASGATHPGTYRGVGEMATYFKELGVNAVLLRPVLEVGLTYPHGTTLPLSYFAPEHSLAAERASAVDEVKEMVETLHSQGLEVLIEVHFAGTGEGGVERLPGGDTDPNSADILSLRGLDNVGYYALETDPKQYKNLTGAGNTLRTNTPHVRRLVLDSLHYWADELHVDGFFVDSAVSLGLDDVQYGWANPRSTVIQAIVDDALLQRDNVRLIGEPWGVGSYVFGQLPVSQNLSTFAWSELSAGFKPWWLSFVNRRGDQGADYDWRLNDKASMQDGPGLLTGSHDPFGMSGRAPFHSINYVSWTWSLTLYDSVRYDTKLNGCGPLNPICCDTPLSDECTTINQSGEWDTRSRDWVDEPTRRQMARNLLVGLLVSQGTPMLNGGDEWLRTQYGSNNAFAVDPDNASFWFDWAGWKADDARVRMHDFVAKLLQIRRRYAHAFAPSAYTDRTPMAWKNETNQDMAPTDWSSRHTMMHFWDASRGPEVVVLINMESTPVTFVLPDGKPWIRRIDTNAYFDTSPAVDESPKASLNVRLDDSVTASGTYNVPPRVMVVLTRQ